MEIKGKARFPARIKGKHLRDQRTQKGVEHLLGASATDPAKESFEEEQELKSLL